MKTLEELNAEWDATYRHSFRAFLWYCWLHIPEIAVEPSEIQYDIAFHLQYGEQRTVIEALRGIGKSFITCAYAAWRLKNNADEAVLIVSASQIKAQQNGRFIRDLIYTIDLLQSLRLTDASRRNRNRKVYDSVLAFDVEGASIKQVPSVQCAGVEGQVTGARATIIICDDIEISTNSLTKIQRDKISLLVTEFEAVIKPGANNRIIYLGTPHNADSLYNSLQQKGYSVVMWPAEVPDDGWMERYGPYLGPCIRKLIAAGAKPGTPTEPRFNEWELVRKRATFLAGGYAKQFMLDTRMNDALKFPLKLRDLVIMDLDIDRAPVHIAWGSNPELIWPDLDPVCNRGDYAYRPFRADPRMEEYTASIMTVDPSGAGADQTAVCVLKLLHGRLFCLELFGLDGGYSLPVLERIARTAKKHKVNRIIVETNMGGGGDRGGMFGELLRPVLAKHHQCPIEGVWNSQQKELRICDTLEPVMGSHRLVIDKRIIQDDDAIADENYKFCYQLTRMTRERGCLKHDDLIDELAEAVAQFEEFMALDEEEAQNQYEDEQWEKMVEEFMESAGTDQPAKRPAYMGNSISRTG